MSLSQKQTEVLTGLRAGYTDEKTVKVERDWVWVLPEEKEPYEATSHTGMLAQGFMWSPKRRAYYHMCGVVPKGKRKWGGKPRYKTPEEAKMQPNADAIAKAIVAGAQG